MPDEKIIIYTDGSSRQNPGPGGWGVSLQYPNGKVVELGGAEGHTTNNKMELMAILRALEYVRDHMGKWNKVELNSDSAYALQGATKWIYGWYKNGWLTAEGQPVANREVWEAIYQLMWLFKNKCDITFTKVSGHTGVLGNERADLIATKFADGERILLYTGGGRDYEKLLGTSLGKKAGNSEEKALEKKKKKERLGPGFSYISMIGGLIEIHKNWADCEARVKGKSGAKYKKAMSPEEESDIILEWTTREKAVV